MPCSRHADGCWKTCSCCRSPSAGRSRSSPQSCGSSSPANRSSWLCQRTPARPESGSIDLNLSFAEPEFAVSELKPAVLEVKMAVSELQLAAFELKLAVL